MKVFHFDVYAEAVAFAQDINNDAPRNAWVLAHPDGGWEVCIVGEA